MQKLCNYLRCYSCNVEIFLEPDHEQKLRNNHKDFFCINGHPQAFIGKSAAEKRADALAETLRLTEDALTRESRLRAEAEEKLGRSERTCEHCGRLLASVAGMRQHIRLTHQRGPLKLVKKTNGPHYGSGGVP